MSTYRTHRDDYGRTCREDYARRGVVVTMPRRTAHVRPAGENYMVNLHNPAAPGDVTMFATLSDALAFHAANAEARQ